MVLCVGIDTLYTWLWLRLTVGSPCRALDSVRPTRILFVGNGGHLKGQKQEMGQDRLHMGSGDIPDVVCDAVAEFLLITHLI